MKFLIVLSLLIIPGMANLKAQPKISVFTEVSPNICYRSIKNISSDNSANEDKAFIGYTLSYKTGIPVNENFYLISGVEYNAKRLSQVFFQLNDKGIIVQKEGTITYNYVEIPFYVKYLSSQGKIHISPVAGLSYGRLVSIALDIDDVKSTASGSDIKQSSFAGSSLNLHFGLEFSCFIAEKVSLKAEPKFDYGLTNVIKSTSTPIKEHLYIAGVNFGFIFWL